MTSPKFRKSLLCLSLAVALGQPVHAQVADSFVAADIRVDGKPVHSTAEAVQALGLDGSCMGTGSLVHFYRVNQRQQVLSSAGEACKMNDTQLQAMLKRLSITLHYESLYGDAATHRVL